jgi:hypothetical protein
MALLKRYRFDVDVLVDTDHKEAPDSDGIIAQITEQLIGDGSKDAIDGCGIHEVNVKVRGTVRTDYGQ